MSVVLYKNVLSSELVQRLITSLNPPEDLNHVEENGWMQVQLGPEGNRAPNNKLRGWLPPDFQYNTNKQGFRKYIHLVDYPFLNEGLNLRFGCNINWQIEHCLLDKLYAIVYYPGYGLYPHGDAAAYSCSLSLKLADSGGDLFYELNGKSVKIPQMDNDLVASYQPTPHWVTPIVKGNRLTITFFMNSVPELIEADLRIANETPDKWIIR